MFKDGYYYNIEPYDNCTKEKYSVLSNSKIIMCSVFYYIQPINTVSDDDDDDETDGSSDTFYDATSALHGESLEDLQRPSSPAPLCKLNSVSIPCDISCPQPPGISAIQI